MSICMMIMELEISICGFLKFGHLGAPSLRALTNKTRLSANKKCVFKQRQVRILMLEAFLFQNQLKEYGHCCKLYNLSTVFGF